MLDHQKHSRDQMGDIRFHQGNREDVLVVSAHRTCHHYPKHTHDAFCFGVMHDGAQDSAYGRRHRVTEAGDVMLVNPGEVHDGLPLDDYGRSFQTLYVEPALVADAAREAGVNATGNLEIGPGATADRELARIIHILHRGYQLGEGPLGTDGLLTELLGKLVRRHGTERITESFNAAAAVAAVQQRLADDPLADYSLDDLAAQCGLSKFHFLRSFKRAYGLSPYAYLMQIRLELGLERLRRGDSVTRAGQEAGFYDQAHFTRHFRRKYGATPGAVRLSLS